MQIYTFYVGLLLLLIKKTTDVIGQLNINNITYIIYIYSYFTVPLPFSEACIPMRNTKGNIAPYILSLKVLKFKP